MPYWFEPQTTTVKVGPDTFTLETGRMAKQASSCVVTWGETVVLVTATNAKPRPGIDFFPLTVDFVEKTSAAGKIPGGFFKREGRLSDREVLVSRFIDRSIRPLFADGYADETQVIATVLSADGEHQPDVAAFLGASTALTISPLPFLGPIAAVRVGRVNGELVVNPKVSQREESELDLIVAGSRNAVVMVEGGAKEIPEAEMVAALKFGHDNIVPQLDPQLDLQKRVGRDKIVIAERPDTSALEAELEGLAEDRLREAVQIRDKHERYAKVDEITKEIVDAKVETYRAEKVTVDSLGAFEERQAGLATLQKQVKSILKDIHANVVRELVLSERRRIDGRATDEIRNIASEITVVPRAHGTGLFTRGETQALVYTTLGSSGDQQTIDALTERYEKRFLLHYNFPPFSVGEARFLRGPGRREVGHGTLAERALTPVLPDHEDFPYTIRIVSEVLESNGSSSMATVCGGTLSLLDAGVKIKAPVAGIAMGLIQDGDRVAVLSDILGDEDHLGDMDFKVCGTREGITALQMDIKITEVDWDVMERALAQAREGRLHILDCMEKDVKGELGGLVPRGDLSAHAPRVEVIWIKPDRIRDVIGPGGKVIRAIQDTTGAKIDIEDSGQVTIFSPDRNALQQAQAMVEELTQEAEIGKVYLGKVKRVADFGCFVEIFPGTDGLVHISHLAEGRVDRVTDVADEGDELMVKCIDIDPSGRIRLSRKEALADAIDQA
jgi:polyribonucleotide nucleotidyltransferase